jgi:hypothetical protein
MLIGQAAFFDILNLKWKCPLSCRAQEWNTGLPDAIFAYKNPKLGIFGRASQWKNCGFIVWWFL